MEYPPPYKTSDVFNDTNQDSHVEAILKFDESELLQYVRKAGDSMQGNLRAPEFTLYGESSKLIFHDGSYMTTASGATANETKLTDITYNSGTSTTTIANNGHINNLTAGNINTSHLSGTTSNVQSQIDSTVNNTSTNSSNISALQTLTSQHTDDISQNTSDIESLESTQTYILGEVDTLKSTNNQQSTDITNLQTATTNNTNSINSLTTTVNTNTSDITGIKTKTNKLVVTPYGDLDIITTGTCNVQIGTVKDDIGTDDGTNRISIGVYEGNNVADASGNPNYAIPQNTAGIFGKMYSDFIVASRGNQNHEGLILSGCAYNSGGQTDQGSHIFINKQGLVSIGANSRTKYTEGFRLNVQGTTKLDGNVTLTGNLNAVTPTQLSYLDATSSIQTQLNNRLPLAGGTMTGAINMNSNNITNVGNIQLSTINGSPYVSEPSFETAAFTPYLRATDSSPSVTYVKNTGRYVKISNSIHYTIHMEVSNKSGLSGILYIETNLPYIPQTAITHRYPVSVGNYSGISENKICGLNAYLDNSRSIYFIASIFTPASNSFSQTSMTQGQASNSFYVTLQGHYFF